MSEKNTAPNPFDLDRLRELIRMMEEHDLNEVDLQKGDQRCRLRRKLQVPHPPMMAAYPMAAAPAPAVAPAPAAASESKGGAPAAAPVESGLTVKSPTLGTYYSAASPDDEPFVKVGSKVQRDTVVCLVEAMKVYNQVTADVEGTVTEVCVANGDAVEFGQVLFRVRPS